MVVEQVFRLPGLSYMLIDGLTDKDTSRILVVVLFSVVLVRIVSLLANFLYLVLNPRYNTR
jgi:ABC-type dipeptide/oligopeptide/nickel transport system permease component